MVLAITVFQHTQKDFENVSTEAESDSAGLHSPETSAILLRSVKLGSSRNTSASSSKTTGLVERHVSSGWKVTRGPGE